MAPTAAAEIPKYVLLTKDTLNIPSDALEGPSPYAEKYKEGPSYKPVAKRLKVSGILDKTYHFKDITPVIGREYPEAQLKDILNDDEKIRDLAITVSRRGVVFFRNQNLNVEEQKKLADLLGRLTGKPDTSGLHIHPTAAAGGFLKDDGSGEIDPEVSIISSELAKDLYKKTSRFNRTSNEGWHSDVTFEPVPSDYAILKIIETPPSGGDTLWASGTALYDKISPSLRSYLNTLTGVYSLENFHKAAEGKFNIYSAQRGAPENVGETLIATHPIVRTSPVTGWNSIFSIGSHFSSFNGVTPEEVKLLYKYFIDLLVGSHDIQVIQMDQK
jgi:alpha-ketoglutarate-dependent taurine dioxygenase